MAGAGIEGSGPTPFRTFALPSQVFATFAPVIADPPFPFPLIRLQLARSQTCTRCDKGRVPAMLQEFKLRKSKKKPGRKNKRRDEDLDEDTDQEEDRIRKLGAWIECGVW